MSHRKSHSHGSIPFSWEDKPGVCKTPNECPLNIGSQQGITQKSSSTLLPPPPLVDPSHLSNSRRMLDKKIPLPPCLLQPPRRSTSEKDKGFRWQEDPFLVAYKECTKSEKNYKVPRKNKRGVGSNFSLSKSIFSCRSANDVQDDIYVKLSRRPCLPAGRDRSLTLEDEHKRGFNYETWL
ncbi:hypothetical protein Fmac_027250 [Flemingia macrophylla]|uniref:Uncharacterized protein n=1 Tax=Flemingia macrophylla TaxID=520843 RepID=A0ABD1LH71_9FABA